MKKQLALVLGGLTLLGANMLPVRAAGSAGDTMTTVAMVPVKAVALVTCAVVGTPIAVVRKVTAESMDATTSIAGDKANPGMVGLCSLAGIPIGLFKGGVEGLWLGSYNSYSNNDKPFCKEAWSLGDMSEK